MGVDQSPAGGEPPAGGVVPRRQRMRFGQWPLAAVLAGVLAGLVVVVLVDFRPGALIIGGTGVTGGLLRLFLPARRAGMLVVRSRAVDVAVLLALSMAIAALAVVVPPPPA